MAKEEHEISYLMRIKDQISGAVTKIKARVKGFESTIQRASKVASEVSGKSTSRIKKAWDNVSTSIRGAGAKISAGVKNFTSQFKEAGNEAGIFSGRLGSMLSKLGPTAIAVGALALAVGGLAMAYTKAFEAGTEFELSLSRLGAITQASAEDMAKLEQQAKFLGETTAFSAKESADAFTEMAKLGLKTNDIIASSASVLNLASASQMDMATSANALVATLKQFNLSADQSTMVSDVMAKSFTSSALDMTKFTESMKFAGPVAQATGVSITKATGALGILADRSIHGSQAGTALRRVMLELSNSSSKVGKVLKSVGAENESFTNKLRVLRDMNLSTADTTELFGLLASTTAQVLIKEADAVEDLSGALEDSRGSAERMAKQMMDNTKGSMKLFESRLEGVKLQLFSTFGAQTNKLVQFFTNKLEMLSVFIADNEEAFIFWGKVVADVIKGIVNFFTSLVDAVNMVFRILVGNAFAFAGAFLKPFQAVFNKIIEGYNWVAEKVGKEPIEFKFEIADNLLGEAGRTFQEAGDLAKDIGHRFMTGRERRAGGGATAVDVGATGPLAQAESAVSPEDVMASVLGDKDAQDKAVEEARKQAEKLEKARLDEWEKARQLQNSLMAENRTAQMTEDQAEIERVRMKYAEKEALLKAHGFETTALEEAKQNEITAIEAKYAKKREEIAKKEAEMKLQASVSLYKGVASLASAALGNSKKNANAQKRIAQATAIVDTYVGANKALGSAPPPYNFILMAGVIAQGLANVANIQSQQFATGGIVGGTAFTGDTIQARLNSGEMVLNRAQQRNLFAIAEGKRTARGGVNIGGSEVNITMGSGADTDEVARVVDEALERRNVDLARRIRQNEEYGVTA